MKLKYTLFAFNDGDRRWAFRFVRHSDGKAVTGIVSGGESNIYAILRHFNPKVNDWDRSIQFVKIEKTKREFSYLVTDPDWKYAGCCPEDLAEYIRKELRKRSKPCQDQ
jgi:hypothetical protein